MVKKQIVCLANSRMEGDRCIAGKDIESGNWIRPVNKPGAGLSENERQSENWKEPELLDIIEVSLVIPYPYYHHSENWLLASDSRLKCKRQFDRSDLAKLADNPKDLWGTDLPGDCVSLDRIRNYSRSLYFIKVQDMVLYSKKKNKVRGKFAYVKKTYDFAVTDPKIEQGFNREPNDKLHIKECYVTVSLAGNPFQKSYYKFIAAIVTPERAGE